MPDRPTEPATPRDTPYTDVRGRCPACGSTSLFLAAGGYITCALAECPEPDAASILLERSKRTDAAPHACTNCEGIDPDTCLMNPDRPPEQCPNSEFDGYGSQSLKEVGHNLCSFEMITSGAPDA
jgi:hypothetical protein